MLLLMTYSEEEQEKFTTIFHQHYKTLIWEAYNILHSYHLAEDAVEDYYSRINEYLNGDSGQDDGLVIGSYLEQYSVDATQEGEYLLDPDGNCIAGPYRKVYADDLKWCWDEACRYEDNNGMLGYLAPDGKELTSALFVEASEISDGKARVREATGGVYYINSSFERISDDYIDGFEYEHQGFLPEFS